MTLEVGQVERVVGELECDCDSEVPWQVLLYEDGYRQEDGTVLWSGCAHGECEGCGQCYADWWEGTFKIGEPTKRAEGSSDDLSQTAPTDSTPQPDDQPIGPH